MKKRGREMKTKQNKNMGGVKCISSVAGQKENQVDKRVRTEKKRKEYENKAK